MIPTRSAGEGRRLECRSPTTRSLRAWLSLAALPLLLTGLAFAQSSPEQSDATRIERLERSLESVVEENRRLGERVRELESQRTERSPNDPAPLLPEAPGMVRMSAEESLPLLFEPDPEPLLWSSPPVEPRFESPADDFRVGYDNGFVIASRNPDEVPFTLKINSQNMFRFNEFVPAAEHWTDSAGNRTPIQQDNSFQIPRGRLIFSGTVFDPNLSYLLSIDYNTVNSNPIGFRAYELSYRFSRAAEVHIGQGKVPGSREWLETAFAPLEGPDRSMATTFFRPSLSQGIWFTGEPVDGLHYQAMMSNGFNTLNLTPGQISDRFCWSGSTWWEPWGNFGRGYVDLEAHTQPVVRLGGSYTFARGQGSQAEGGAVENSSIRLSDGTLITQTGAFAPGVTLQSYDISLLAIDAAYKYRGMSLSTEWYLQDLFALKGNGPLPTTSTLATGGTVRGGCFVLPQTIEAFLRASLVTGRYGTGSESAGGFNWFPMPGKSNLRFTFDTAWLDGSPASQSRTGYVAGQTGLLIRTQIMASY